ncbi:MULTISPECIES: undecaprenyldiphospho-muramoylpentapeptide beta-N-acetylglucosaminyltransferase [Gemella]|uniref:undecaprenyldiphospho-muramoylpentapeptide beta-N-acetylglucosaminyltransferase n=1 Tax=Gemella TaxID=1378 RepID=UPI0007680D45|nr:MULTISPECIES: undecaprenyldiphospho-muramoylpentapeptide beta-N-acetylglucosaminyltransferase [Gemella]AME09790.1 UDP-N-acetylglucosamine--N-acetylmuramyl-(pentapeptide) pyrophosphoryl-undecaprenol N-acetylglucosamine transferase [Gemella sp. oral taxon 928]AXI27390.1 undecaprenyldiphospho-muramoylpentapeptide beta-N- acetylglucosaminyltransferase [Gemella sp. ND 6198]
MNKVLFTGGGSAGHVSVNVALIPEFKKNGYKISYIGSKKGIEKEMIEKISDVKYYAISSGKLRRYFSWENFVDPFKVLKGIIDAILILKKEKPDFVFSKGGFVSVPVCIAAKLLKIPVVLHESDLTPGLANKINIKFCDHIFTTFEDTIKYLPNGKASLIGAIVRDDIYSGKKEKGYEFTDFNEEKPIILVMGGSLGSKILNDYIWNNISELVEKYQIIHLVGKGLINDNIVAQGYRQYEFLSKELFDVFQITDFTISRAGANALYEFLALEKPAILVPLGINQSRGDQIENAKFFEKNNFSKVIFEEEFVDLDLTEIGEFYNNLDRYKKSMIEYKKEKKVINNVTDFYKKILNIVGVRK